MTLTECNLSDRKNKVHLTALVIFEKMFPPPPPLFLIQHPSIIHSLLLLQF